MQYRGSTSEPAVAGEAIMPKTDSTADAKSKPASAATDEVQAQEDEDFSALSREDKALKAERIVKDHVLLAMAAGCVPSPGFDVAAGFGVQLTMLARLSNLYGVPYTRNIAKGSILSLLTSVGGIGMAGVVGISAIKIIPWIGTTIGMVAMPATMGALTFALGKVFSEHFASGGTFLNFNPKAWATYFRSMFKRGKEVASEAAAKAKATIKGKTGEAAAAAA